MLQYLKRVIVMLAIERKNEILAILQKEQRVLVSELSKRYDVTDETIRRDLEKDFKEIIGNRIEKIARVEYAYQELDKLPEGFSVPEGRKKPWGTGHAILMVKDLVHEPFLVINADDYYGKEGFRKVHDYMVEHMDETKEPMTLCMAGFALENTLS